MRPRAKARVKARVTQMASKLYCQLKALHKTAPLGATNSIKVVTNSFNLCLVCCLLLLGTWLQADFGICMALPLILTSEKKIKSIKLSAIS